ncbi:hypothetical protein Tsubulata_004168 [Turnera subulata]|uniref:RING-type domain-containing protein n=1 Tax=Turnera subulata TaxID=218843 RepID=A0A9Q0FBP5_9ROSI|nr:hypothetical protein Tsubulata_004168 [Turnera subulata]
MQVMEEMDTDRVIDIPDTPDRVASRHIGNMGARKERTSSVAVQPRWSEVIGEESLHRQRDNWSRSVYENGHTRRLHLQSASNPFVADDNFEPLNKSDASCSVENSYPSQKAPLFRRPGSVTFRPEKHFAGPQHIEKRKTLHPESTKMLSSIRDDALVDLTKEDKHEKMFDMAFPREASKLLLHKGVRGVQVPSNGGSSSGISSLVLKGKEKIDMNRSNDSRSAVNCGKNMAPSGDSQCRAETHLAMPHLPCSSPRVPGKRRLVRNGCISPSNIAEMAQKVAEKRQIGSSDGMNQTMELVSSGQSKIDIMEIVAEDYNRCKAKGKGPMTQSPMEKDHDADTSHVFSSSSVAANGIGCAPGKESIGCWRSIHNRGKEIEHSVSRDDARCFINEEVGNRMLTRNNVSGSQQGPVGTRLCKRRKTEESTSRNGNDSVIVLDDSKIVCSSRASSSSSPATVQNNQRRTHLRPIHVIDDSPSRIRNGNVGGTGPACSEESDARARQLEADERLARELQEQLYHEMPTVLVDEIDEHIARQLQEEEGAAHHPVSRPRGSSTRSRGRGQRQLRSSGIPSNRRGTQVQVANIRASQSRSRIINRHPISSRYRNRAAAAISRGHNFHFPLSMDLDMRLDFLEALETAMLASHTLNIQNDFNENDYEMLLALDDNNVRAGASANQIDGLPESVVQTDNFEETCAVCLDVPTIGETIRHLPCLHKFHKTVRTLILLKFMNQFKILIFSSFILFDLPWQCIDPWLSRKPSCPVCKSSVT